MIASKGQLVTLTDAALLLTAAPPGASYEPARVQSLCYLDQPEGERGVQLDRDLGGSRWWNEGDLQEAT